MAQLGKFLKFDPSGETKSLPLQIHSFRQWLPRFVGFFQKYFHLFFVMIRFSIFFWVHDEERMRRSTSTNINFGLTFQTQDSNQINPKNLKIFDLIKFIYLKKQKSEQFIIYFQQD